MPSKTKTCPYCSETIKENAKKCRYCGEWLTEKPQQPLDATTFIKNALVSRYEILEEIGRGGMSVVFKAVQKSLERTVALKVLPQQFTHDREFLERFHREARAAAKLNHPNIVTIHDEGAENGVHYIAMEYLDGQDLHARVRQQGALPVEAVKNWIAAIAEGLGYAHGQGLIHRDIKSANIVITKEDRPVLTDFGIARAGESSKLTQTGTVLGTPEYMSPEQARGETLDAHSDIYSLGVVLYECLTGQLPFQSETLLGTIHQITHDPPTPPKGIRSDIPERLQNVVLRCLAKTPETRYPSCKALIAALDAGETKAPRFTVTPTVSPVADPRQGGKPGKAPPPGSPTWLRPAIGVTGGILLAILGMIIIRSDLFHSKPGSESHSVRQPQSAEHIFQNLGIEWVRVPGGSFEMGDLWGDGDGDEKPVHTVTVSGFYLSKYEVTFAQYDAFCEASGRGKPNDEGWGRGKRPVINVSWEDAGAFCRWLSSQSGGEITLPSEAQWEYAARSGGKKEKWAGTNSENSLGSYAWYDANSGSQTHPVGQKRPNGLGLYDMSGNVWEWCRDVYSGDAYRHHARSNPIYAGSGAGRVIRGGSWSSLAGFVRCVNRLADAPVNRRYYLGFRLCKK